MENKLINQSRNITLDSTTEVKCDECESITFTEAVMMRKASRLLTGQPKDSYVPIPTFVCVSCGHVNDEFLPNELKKPKLQT
jgi:uncharacterized Zn finger protein